jgi:hypothetical protein
VGEGVFAKRRRMRGSISGEISFRGGNPSPK